MTVKENLINMLVQNGLFESQAIEVLKLGIPLIEEANKIATTDPEDETVKPYHITWDADKETYPAGLYSAWFVTIKPVALKWIDENKPQAWYRDMFL